MPDSGNEAQIRVMLDQVAEAAATNVAMKLKVQQIETSAKEAPIPPLIKWLVTAIGGFGSAALIGLGIWLVSSVSTMRETLARMDERMASAASSQDDRYGDLQRRVTVLEGYHQGGGV